MHIDGHQPAVLIGVEGIKDGIAAQPFLTANAAISIEVVKQKYFVHCVAEGGAPFQLGQPVGELGLHGEVRRVPGVLSLAYMAKAGQKLIVPTGNEKEAALILAKPGTKAAACIR